MRISDWSSDVCSSDLEGFGKAIGGRLRGIADLQPERRSVAQQRREHRQVARGGDDQYLADAAEHQRRQRIIDHRLVEHGQKLLREDRKSVVSGKSVSVRVDLGGRRIIKKKK